MGTSRPTGTVTFAFTDVEGSTRRWAVDAESMARCLEIHDAIVRASVEAHRGDVFATGGDGFGIAFQSATDAVDSMLDVQARLAAAEWPADPLRVRIGLHRGVAQERDDDYFGPVVNLTARLCDAGHGGQVLASRAVVDAAAVAGRPMGDVALRDVEHRIEVLQLDDGDHPPLRVTPTGPVSIPSARSSILGRDLDVRAVRTALVDHRLVTIAGPGGTGKTRLSVAVAESEITGRADGVIFVDLTQVSRDGDVDDAVAAACRIPVAPDERVRDRIVDELAARSMLLVVDNCEHVVDAAADLADALLDRRGPCRVLTTSREALDVEGEYVVALAPLPTDDAESPSARLFRERAEAAGAMLAADRSASDAIVQICTRLDGLPLAIELAAARTAALSPAQILAQLTERGIDALDDGARRRRTSRGARRSLTATVSWSYDLLDGDERHLFDHASLFPAHFLVADLAALCGWDESRTQPVLESLVARSLVVAEHWPGHTVFRLLETLRAFAAQRMAERGGERDALDRLARFVSDFYVLEDPRLAATRWQTMFVDRATIERCHDHSRSMGDPVLSERLLAILAASTIVVSETRRIDHLVGDPETFAVTNRWNAGTAIYLGDKAHQLGDRDAAEAWYRCGRASGSTDETVVPIRSRMGLKLASVLAVDRPTEARAVLAEAEAEIERFERLTVEDELSADFGVGTTRALLGDLDEAIARLRLGVERNATLDYVNTAGQIVIHFLAGILDTQGEHDEAAELFEQYQFVDHTLDAIHFAHLGKHAELVASLHQTKGLVAPGPTGPLAYDAVLSLAGIDVAHGREERAVELILRAGWVGFANCVLVTWARRLGCFEELVTIAPDPQRYRGLGRLYLDRVDDYIAEAEALAGSEAKDPDLPTFGQ